MNYLMPCLLISIFHQALEECVPVILLELRTKFFISTYQNEFLINELLGKKKKLEISIQSTIRNKKEGKHFVST